MIQYGKDDVMASDTKERILEKALEMFSERGYAGTNLRELAQSLGIVKSALYRHYTSKEEIWDAVISMVNRHYNEHFGSADRMPAIPGSMEELKAMTMGMVNFTVHDEMVIRMRRLMLTEQFRDEKIRRLASFHFLYSTEAIFTKVFAAMMEKGIIRPCDPEILAFSYTAPVTALIHLCDREPEKENEAMEKLQKFIGHFCDEYTV